MMYYRAVVPARFMKSIRKYLESDGGKILLTEGRTTEEGIDAKMVVFKSGSGLERLEGDFSRINHYIDVRPIDGLVGHQIERGIRKSL